MNKWHLHKGTLWSGIIYLTFKNQRAKRQTIKNSDFYADEQTHYEQLSLGWVHGLCLWYMTLPLFSLKLDYTYSVQLLSNSFIICLNYVFSLSILNLRLTLNKNINISLTTWTWSHDISFYSYKQRQKMKKYTASGYSGFPQLVLIIMSILNQY